MVSGLPFNINNMVKATDLKDWIRGPSGYVVNQANLSGKKDWETGNVYAAVDNNVDWSKYRNGQVDSGVV